MIEHQRWFVKPDKNRPLKQQLAAGITAFELIVLENHSKYHLE